MCVCVEKLLTCVVTFIIRADYHIRPRGVRTTMLVQLQQELEYVYISIIGFVCVVFSRKWFCTAALGKTVFTNTEDSIMKSQSKS